MLTLIAQGFWSNTMFLRITALPRVQQRPLPGPKYQASAPIPSLLTFLNSRDTRIACFCCPFIYDLLRFNYNKHTDPSESKVYNGTTVCEITNHYFNKRKQLILTLRSNLDNDVVFTFLLTIYTKKVTIRLKKNLMSATSFS